MTRIEPWTPAAARKACREAGDPAAGDPYHVAIRGKVETVTRRCAQALYRAGEICGAKPAPQQAGAGTRRQRHPGARTLTITLTPDGAGGWELSSPEMNHSSPTINPARTAALLATEWVALVEAEGPSDFAAWAASLWRDTAPRK